MDPLSRPMSTRVPRSLPRHHRNDRPTHPRPSFILLQRVKKVITLRGTQKAEVLCAIWAICVLQETLRRKICVRQIPRKHAKPV
jgi:hypothetical protein